MAKFFYKMQNILNIKYKMEEQVKAELAEANYRHAMEIEKLNSYVSRKFKLEEELRELYNSKLNIQQIKLTISAIDKMKDMIAAQIIEVNKASEVVEQVRARLEQAMVERKTHEKLKERAFEVFLEELKKEDDKEIDELNSYRYGGSNGEERQE